MKTKPLTILLLILLAVSQSGYTQGVGTVFNQDQTQNKYLMEQIAALQVYEQYMQKGYKVVKAGTGTISNIKNGDLGLHGAYFDSLSTVSNRVSHYSKVNDMIRLQQQIITGHRQTYSRVSKNNQLTAAELISYNNAYEGILKQCQSDMDELKLLLTNGKLKMTDDARIALIDKLHERLQNYYQRSTAMNQQALALSVQRSRERKDHDNLKNLYGN